MISAKITFFRLQYKTTQNVIVVKIKNLESEVANFTNRHLHLHLHFFSIQDKTAQNVAVVKI